MITLKEAINLCRLGNTPLIKLRAKEGGIFDYYHFTLRQITERFDMQAVKVFQIDFNNYCFEFTINVSPQELQKLFFKH